MTDLVKYSPALPLARVGTCDFCNTENVTRYNDHCHTHGWVRGFLCVSCNVNLGNAENNKPTALTDLSSVNIYRARCPECIALNSLTPTLTRDDIKGLRVTSNVHTAFSLLQYRIASETGTRVTASAIETALLVIADTHYAELLSALKQEAE